DGLAHAHAHGVIHRDVKPSNLLLDSRGTVWIADFGLAKAEGMADVTNSGDIVGTLRYMAPERFRGQTDARGDVYSLGLTLYEMLTLRPAFDNEDRAGLIATIVNESPPRPRKVDPRVPRDLETIVLKASAKDPANRYAGAAEMAEDLRRFLADRPVRARRSTVLEQLGRWRRRNPTVAALTVAIFLLLAVLAGGGWIAAARWRAENTRATRAESATSDKLADSLLNQA